MVLMFGGLHNPCCVDKNVDFGRSLRSIILAQLHERPSIKPIKMSSVMLILCSSSLTCPRVHFNPRSQPPRQHQLSKSNHQNNGRPPSNHQTHHRNLFLYPRRPPALYNPPHRRRRRQSPNLRHPPRPHRRARSPAPLQPHPRRRRQRHNRPLLHDRRVGRHRLAREHSRRRGAR